jgi:hypothetical protein
MISSLFSFLFFFEQIKDLKLIFFLVKAYMKKWRITSIKTKGRALERGKKRR